MSPTTNTSGKPGSEQSGSTGTRPARSTATPAWSARCLPRVEAATPAAHTIVRASVRVLSPSAPCTSMPFASTSTTAASSRISTPMRSSRAAAFAASRSSKEARMVGAPSMRMTCAWVGIDPAVVASQGVTGELGDLARHLDAGRSGAHDHEGQPLRGPHGVGLDLGELERTEDPSPQLEGVVDGLQSGRMIGEPVVAEVGLRGSRCHDETVVGDRLRTLRRPGGDGLGPHVDVDDLPQAHLHVVLVPHDLSGRRGDGSLREDARRHLVQQRLEEVVVGLGDHHDVHVRALQRLGGEQAAEP